ncbi:MAG: hypothetical protein IKR18_07565, partial [Bacteroidaceae bacterium]|nr:hypothetical protein [Bacteroidaceae bacterium]
MKKTVLILLCILGMSKAYSQSDGALHIEAGLTLGTSSHSVMPTGVNIDLNYDLTKCLSVHALAQADYFIPKEGL